MDKITATYAIVGKKNKQKWERVERCIRHEIECYYNRAKVPPILENRWSKRKRFSNKEFLARLYRMIYLGQGGEK
ncbi:MAG: sporulation initiation factor Spo0A C-terminal domain-containing protein [Anaerotignum sp.]